MKFYCVGFYDSIKSASICKEVADKGDLRAMVSYRKEDYPYLTKASKLNANNLKWKQIFCVIDSIIIFR